MSTNAVDHRQRTSRKFTVAELVARERTATMAVRPTYDDDGPRTYVPVAELLRREGIEYVGDNEPTAEMPAVQSPVLTAPVGSAAELHVTDLLRREGELPEERKRRLPGRAATVGSAAVLCGLTIAGLVALKPNIALSPVSDAPDDPDRQFSASPGTRQDAAAELKRGGGAAPTTVSSLLRNDTANAASPAGSLNGDPTPTTGATSSTGGGTGGSTVEPTSAPGGSGGSDSTGTPSERTSEPEEPAPSDPPEDDSSPLDPVLDTLGDAVGAVGKVGGSIEGVIPSSSVAVQQSINGLLGL